MFREILKRKEMKMWGKFWEYQKFKYCNQSVDVNSFENDVVLKKQAVALKQINNRIKN